MLNGQLLALRPVVFHGIEREDRIVILNPLAGFFGLRHEVIQQMRGDPQNFLLPHSVVDEFVVKTLRDQLEHLVTLLLDGRCFVVRFAHLTALAGLFQLFGIFSSFRARPSRLRKVASTLGTYICVSAGKRSAIASKVRALYFLSNSSTRVSPAL